jgi:hypothetical protein
MSKDSSIGRYYHEGWEFQLFVVRISGEGNISGTVEIRRVGLMCSLLTSSGVFKTKQQLANHLKARAIAWAQRHAGTTNGIDALIERQL